MIRLLKALFGPREEFSSVIHFHIDDAGNRVFCDESACRPANDSLLAESLRLQYLQGR